MSAHEHWTDQLSDYLDGELGAAEQSALETHLAGCAECSQTLNELRTVALTARSLSPRAPADDLWKGIAGRLDPPVLGPTRTRRVSFSVTQLAAAAVLLIAVSGLVTWQTMVLRTAPTPQPAADPADAVDRNDHAPLAELAAARLDDPEYDRTVADMKQTLEAGRAQLDPATVKIVEEDLAIIDQAVKEARRALASDPANDYLTEHLIETRKRQLDVLRYAAVLSERFDTVR